VGAIKGCEPRNPKSTEARGVGKRHLGLGRSSNGHFEIGTARRHWKTRVPEEVRTAHEWKGRGGNEKRGERAGHRNLQSMSPLFGDVKKAVRSGFSKFTKPARDQRGPKCDTD